MRIKHFVSWFLIVFGIIGYVTTVPIAYFSNYTILSVPSILEEVDKKLSDMKGMVVDAENILDDFNTSLTNIIYSVSFINFSSIGYTINSTLTSINYMLNETGNTLDSVETLLNETHKTLNFTASMLNENADMMELFSTNTELRLIAPEVADKAAELADTMSSTAEILNELPIESSAEFISQLPIDSTIADINEFQPIISSMLNILEELRLETTTTLQNISNYLDDISDDITGFTSSMDEWSNTITEINDKIWMMKLVSYSIIGYWVLLHTSFLLIGLVFRKQINEEKLV